MGFFFQNKTLAQVWAAVISATLSLSALAGPERPTEFSNTVSVANTRHNLSQRTLPGGTTGFLNAGIMDAFRNNYAEVCVYCHTPHGANTKIELPLWNRTYKNTTYTTYSSSYLSGATTAPGANSLSCLSCHDGTTAIDSVINMPGAGGFKAAQETTQDNDFLTSWAPTDTLDHQALSASTDGTSCLSCHSAGNGPSAAGDFRAYAISTDLTNDHPVGIQFPSSSPDFNATTVLSAKGDRFFDADGDGRMDPKEIRLYNTGDGPEVECASCHDPHGVPSGSGSSQFLPTFLRVTPSGSTICLTCHIK